MWLAGGARKVQRLGLAVLPLLFTPLGCHSRYVNATVANHTGSTISPLEIDYPSASFGTESLADGATFKYRLKLLGSGGTKAIWTDARHQEHSATGPTLHEGQEGTLHVELTPAGATWAPSLTP